MMQNDFRSYVLAVILLSIVLTAAYFIRKSLEEKPFKGKPVEAVFEVDRIYKAAAGGNTDIACVIEGEKIIQTYGVFYSQVEGDKYAGVYDSSNIKNWRIYFYMPVFLPHEKYITREGEITRLWNDAISFDYQINGKILDRFQKMEIGFESRRPDIKVGAKFPVQIWVKDVRRANMYFDLD